MKDSARLVKDEPKERRGISRRSRMAAVLAGLSGAVVHAKTLKFLRNKKGGGIPVDHPVYDIGGLENFAEQDARKVNNKVRNLLETLRSNVPDSPSAAKQHKMQIKVLESGVRVHPEKAVQRFKSVGKAVDSFMKEHDLARQGVRINILGAGKGSGSDYYNPVKNTVNLRTNSSASALHELGRAADVRGNVLKTVLRKIPANAAMIGVPTALAYGDKIREAIPGTVDDKVIGFLQDHPVSAVVGGYGLSTFYPEAKASYLALRHLHKIRGSKASSHALKKYFGPLLASSAAGAVPLGIAAHYGKRFADDFHAKQLQKEASNNYSFSESEALLRMAKRRGFWEGFGSAAPALTVSLGYLYGTEGGKKIRGISRDPGQAPRGRVGQFLEAHPAATAATVGTLGGSLYGLFRAYRATKAS